MGRPTLPELMMGIAHQVAQRSTCGRLQVGCVITNREMTAVDAMGYNGGARGQSNDCESSEPGKCGHLHAEVNALIKANYNAKGKIAFVTVIPCRMCAKALVNGGIETVYFGELYRDNSSIEIFQAAGISVFQLKDGKAETPSFEC